MIHMQNGSFYPKLGGPRTQQERKDQAVVDEVRKVVKERLRNSMISSLQSLQSQFEKLDASGDGLLNQQELIGALQRAGIELNSEQIDSVWRIVDEDQVNPNKIGRDFSSLSDECLLHFTIFRVEQSNIKNLFRYLLVKWMKIE